MINSKCMSHLGWVSKASRVDPGCDPSALSVQIQVLKPVLHIVACGPLLVGDTLPPCCQGTPQLQLAPDSLPPAGMWHMLKQAAYAALGDWDFGEMWWDERQAAQMKLTVVF